MINKLQSLGVHLGLFLFDENVRNAVKASLNESFDSIIACKCNFTTSTFRELKNIELQC